MKFLKYHSFIGQSQFSYRMKLSKKNTIKSNLFFLQEKKSDYFDRVDVLGAKRLPLMVGRSSQHIQIDKNHLARDTYKKKKKKD